MEVAKLTQCLCVVHCQWEWTDYSECSASCGGGVQVRRVVITQEEEQGGEPCPDDIRNITERRECNTTTCSSIHTEHIYILIYQDQGSV